MLKIDEAALKRGYSREEVSHAYDMFLYEGEFEEDGDRDPPKLLTIGPDPAGNLLELIGGEIAGGDYLVWHAMPCRKEYLERFLPEFGACS